MTNREILLEMYEKLWNADKDKWAWVAKMWARYCERKSSQR